MFGDGIFTQEGERWKFSRELLRSQFHFKQYADLVVFRQPLDDLMDSIPQQGGIVDLQPLFFRLTLDTTTAFLFGKSVQSLKTPESAGEQTFAESFNIAQEYVAKRFRLQDLYWLLGGKRFREACRNVHDFADGIIEYSLSFQSRTSKDDKQYVFLRTLARNTPSRTALRDQVINVLAAGRDTTACLLSWMFFLLTRHPNVLAKLRAEINAQSGGKAHLTRGDLRGMNYLQNVLKETLRLYPSVPVNTRTAVRTTVLPTGGGPDRTAPVLVPKGTAVAYSVYAMHRRPDLYGMDAELFQPERWDEEELPLNRTETFSKWIDFALTEAAYTVVRLIQRFQLIQLPNNMRAELIGVEKQTITLVLASTEGCKVELR
ncbi:MAG: hypothetical protein Q9157_005289 [Trypethelium eluteriae]